MVISFPPRSIVCQFLRHRLPQLGGIPAVAKLLRHFLGSQRDENAEDDNPDLTDELAPAVQRFGQMEMHTGPLRAGKLADEPMSAMGGKRTRAGQRQRSPGCFT